MNSIQIGSIHRSKLVSIQVHTSNLYNYSIPCFSSPSLLPSSFFFFSSSLLLFSLSHFFSTGCPNLFPPILRPIVWSYPLFGVKAMFGKNPFLHSFPIFAFKSFYFILYANLTCHVSSLSYKLLNLCHLSP